MVHTSPSSQWNSLLGPWLAKKKRLQLDIWGRKAPPEVDAVINSLTEWIDRVAPGAKDVCPFHWKVDRHVQRAVLESFLSDSLQGQFAGLFRNKSFDELEVLASSLSFENCVQRISLNRTMADHAKPVQFE